MLGGSPHVLALLEKPHVYHAHDASGVHVDLVPRAALALMMLRIAVLDRRVGSLDVSGLRLVWILSMWVLSGVYAYWVRPCLKSEVCVCVPAHLVSISPPTLGNRTRTGASPGSRCVGRSTGTGHELPRTLFLSAHRLPSTPTACLPASYSSHPKTSQNTPYHLIHFCLVPCASLRCLTTAILPRPC